MTTWTRACLALLLVQSLVFPATVWSASPTRKIIDWPPVHILVKKVHEPGKILYRYTVVNGSEFPIARILIGFNDAIGMPELDYGPLGLDSTGVPSTSYKSPAGWDFRMEETEEEERVDLEWTASRGSDILGGSTLDGFEVALGDSDENWPYEGGHWVTYLNSTEQMSFSGRLQPSEPDTIPPSGIGQRVLVRQDPGRNAVRIQFETPGDGAAIVSVVDLEGRELNQILNEKRPAGKTIVLWNGQNGKGGDVPSGTYLVKIWTPDGVRYTKFLWTRTQK